MAEHKDGWIGVDLDGTLVEYDGWKGPRHIGAPIAPMVERVKLWLTQGVKVKVFTARVFAPEVDPENDYTMEEIAGIYERQHEALAARMAIDAFTLAQFGRPLPVTCVKDFGMIELYDDRAVQVEQNTGKLVGVDLKLCRNYILQYFGNADFPATKSTAERVKELCKELLELSPIYKARGRKQTNAC